MHDGRRHPIVLVAIRVYDRFEEIGYVPRELKGTRESEDSKTFVIK